VQLSDNFLADREKGQANHEPLSAYTTDWAADWPITWTQLPGGSASFRAVAASEGKGPGDISG
jgi:hypothetical protein